MDKMAYLQQISTTGLAPKDPTENTGLSRFLTLKNAVIALITTVLLVVTMIVISILTSGENKEQTLLLRSWYRSTYMLETLDDYKDRVKSSDIRAMTSSLEGILREIIYNNNNLLATYFSVEPDDFEEKPYIIDEYNGNVTFSNTLEDAYLSGRVDRVFLRELIYQVAILISYQSECAARSETPEVIEDCEKAETNLNNIYTQLQDFQDLSL